jgi:DNA invertase Pin-like site-specific DNA recombinase
VDVSRVHFISPTAEAENIGSRFRTQLHKADQTARIYGKNGGDLSRRFPTIATAVQALRTRSCIIDGEQQKLDTTPMGKLLFHITGAFAEFERSMIRERVNAGLARAKDALKRNGKFVSKAGIVRTRLGRPGIGTELERKVRAELAKGTGIVKTAKLVGVGNGTVHRIRPEMAA